MAALKAASHFFEWDVESRSDPTPRKVKIRTIDGTLSCNCPRWIFKKKTDEWRSCPHVRGVGQDDFTKGILIGDRLFSQIPGSQAAIVWDLHQRGLPLDVEDVADPGSSVPAGSLTSGNQVTAPRPTRSAPAPRPVAEPAVARAVTVDVAPSTSTALPRPKRLVTID